MQLSHFKSLSLPVIGGKDCKSVTKTPKHEETFKIGKQISVKALHTPCHTQDSICWLMEDGKEKVVFTGDTLFIGGNVQSEQSSGGGNSLVLIHVQRMWTVLRRHSSRDAYGAEQDSGGAAG